MPIVGNLIIYLFHSCFNKYFGCVKVRSHELENFRINRNHSANIMKIVTWNMAYCHRQRFNREAWDYLVNEIRPDIALLQEVNPPDSIGNENLFYTPIGGTRNWGSAIYTQLSLEHVPFESHNGWVAAGEVSLPDDSKLIVASIHAQIINGYVFPNLGEIFDNLSSVLTGKSFAVGGDLNSCRLLDEVYGSKHHSAFFDKIESGDFFNCHRKFHAREQQTFWGRTQNPYQDDHLFVSQNLSEQVVSCEVLTNERILTLSDHSPVSTEINFN